MSKPKQPEPFALNVGGETVHGDLLGNGEPPRILFLHGAGDTNKETRIPFCRHLLAKGVGSVVFDFSGHGMSTGTLRDSSLQKRVNEALEVIDHFGHSFNTICASSMGGYVAIKMMPRLDIQNHVYFAPAIYDEAAYTLPFDERFSTAIRQKDSWKRSDAIGLLADYNGQLDIFIGEEDHIIPDAVINCIDESAIKARKSVTRLAGVGHDIFGWMEDHAEHSQTMENHLCALARSERR